MIIQTSESEGSQTVVSPYIIVTHGFSVLVSQKALGEVNKLEKQKEKTKEEKGQKKKNK